jgi:SHS2 domain-containing protein
VDDLQVDVKIEDQDDGNKKLSARAASWDELFKACAYSLIEEMIDRETVGEEYEEEVDMQREDMSELLFDFLSETVLGMKTDRGIVLSDLDIKVDKENVRVTGIVKGESLMPNKHLLHTDISEVSFDDFIAEKEDAPEKENEDRPYKAEMVLLVM